MLIKILSENADRRLDKFLFAHLNNAPHSFIYKMLRKKRIKLNGRRADGNEILQEGDELHLYLSPETIQSCRKTREIPEAGALTGIIFEDKNLLIVNKPVGLSSHGGSLSKTSRNHKNDNLLARVLYYLYKSGAYNPNADFVPALCNRLDVNTGGLVICGKNLHALQQMNALFANGGIEKEYLAIADGIMGKKGDEKTLKGAYTKNTKTNMAEITEINDTAPPPPVIAVTKYRILSTSKNRTMLSVKPITGRSHQIRAHLASVNHPLSGDKKYGGSSARGALGQLLHCYRLTIKSENLLGYPLGTSWEAPPPSNMIERMTK